MSAAKPSVRQAPAGPEVSRAAYPLLVAAIGLAGAASLLYEVIWVRQLALSLGSTALAGATMLSAFLGGLALGSWLASRRADERPSPARSLMVVEIAAAVLGVLSVPMLEAAGRAYVLVVTGLGATPVAALGLRAVFSLLVMLLPATLFGVAFPLASAAAVRLVGPARAAGGVSAASSFGSAIGAALGGLVLAPLLGVSGSSFVAAALNLAAAGAALLVASKDRR